MKIKKVDDKPMVIHTKKKAKIHMHEPKKAKIKGSNIYTVQRGPKIASAKINDIIAFILSMDHSHGISKILIFPRAIFNSKIFVETLAADAKHPAIE